MKKACQDEAQDQGPDDDIMTCTVSKVADRVTFLNFVTVLERISNCDDSKQKIEKLTKYLEHLRKAYSNLYGTLDPLETSSNNDSLFPIIRLLLPTEDKQRPAFGIKSPTLAKIFAKILGLDEKSEDGRKLLYFKDPKKSGLQAGAGNLPQVIFTVLEKRMSSSPTKKSSDSTNQKPSIKELHTMLDKIVKMGDNAISIDVQCKLLRTFILRLSPLEGMWLAKILLKHLGLGLSRHHIFKCFHAQAQQYYDITRNLEAVCLKLNNPSTKLGDADAGIQLFQPFKPMLCDRVEINVTGQRLSQGHSHSQSQGPQTLVLPTPPFFLEIKFDGERFTIHYDSTQPESQQFCYFSRAGNEWSHVFNLTFTPRLKPQINQRCKSFIIDGEMMAWDFNTKSFTQKGSNINLVTMLPDDPNHCPVFVVFDLLYLDGHDLTNMTLKERMTLLRDGQDVVLVEKEGVIQLNKQILAHSEEQVLNALDEAVNNLEEGLIVKELGSKYQVGKRTSSWVKVKPEYFEDHNLTDLDLVLVGGYYTKSFIRGGTVNHFLAALVDNLGQPGKEEFFPLSRLGPGCLKVAEVNQLVEELQPYFTRKDNPGFRVHMKGIKRPDFYIDPKNSVVLQVKAAEILYNDSVDLKHTLRFPQIVAVRRDKSWQEAMTVDEFHKIRDSHGGKLFCSRNRELPHSVFTNVSPAKPRSPPTPTSVIKTSPSRLPRKPQTPIKSPLNPLRKQHKELEVIEDIFHSRIFVVIGSLDWKPKVETLIHQYGGSIVQNITKANTLTVFAIIAEILSMKTVAFAKQETWDILKLTWVQKCIDTHSVTKILPEHVWSAGPETKRLLALDSECDEYGDSYTKPLTSIETKRLICDIADKADLESETGSGSETSEDMSTKSPLKTKKIRKLMTLADLSDEDLEEEDKIKLNKYNFLKRCKIAFRADKDTKTNAVILASKIKFYGGQVAKDEMEDGVTHVLVFDTNTPVKKKHLSAYVVKDKWLLDSLEKKQIMEENYYAVE